MKTITYACDRCGHTQDSDRKFADTDRWMTTITLAMQDGHQENNNGHLNLTARDTAKVKTVLWCDKCCDEVGLSNIHRLSQPMPYDPAPPTLEDMLREIIREEIGNNQ